MLAEKKNELWNFMLGLVVLKSFRKSSSVDSSLTLAYVKSKSFLIAAICFVHTIKTPSPPTPAKHL